MFNNLYRVVLIGFVALCAAGLCLVTTSCQNTTNTYDSTGTDTGTGTGTGGSTGTGTNTAAGTVIASCQGITGWWAEPAGNAMAAETFSAAAGGETGTDNCLYCTIASTGSGWGGVYYMPGGLLPFTGKTALQFYYKSDAAGTYEVALLDGNNGEFDIFFNIPAANTWTPVVAQLASFVYKDGSGTSSTLDLSNVKLINFHDNVLSAVNRHYWVDAISVH